MAHINETQNYRRILCEVIERHAQLAASTPQPESIPVCDTARDNYLLVDVGWETNERAHYIVLHLRLRDGKVWIEKDGVEYGIAHDLLAAGIPAEDIMLASHDTQPMSLTELAAA
ncbi:MAG: XisI protein [Pyrinomonadaceae bacterium MAG19_C2-C3]|nr:XisI protein [Pyrinomonadaceae bacterium MAG19_C2-C3]